MKVIPTGHAATRTPEAKAAKNQLRFDALQLAAETFAKNNGPVQLSLFKQELSATKAGSEYGINSLNESIGVLVAKGILAKTNAKIINGDGSIKKMKGGAEIIGLPYQIREYDSKFKAN